MFHVHHLTRLVQHFNSSGLLNFLNKFVHIRGLASAILGIPFFFL
uniref:Uncharacterized protein n=1 Tax=Rhizophora mucronata TaxID=61149 RepID=A0A2P2JDJ7_RHIMU